MPLKRGKTKKTGAWRVIAFVEDCHDSQAPRAKQTGQRVVGLCPWRTIDPFCVAKVTILRETTIKKGKKNDKSSSN